MQRRPYCDPGRPSLVGDGPKNVMMTAAECQDFGFAALWFENFQMLNSVILLLRVKDMRINFYKSKKGSCSAMMGRIGTSGMY